MYIGQEVVCLDDLPDFGFFKCPKFGDVCVVEEEVLFSFIWLSGYNTLFSVYSFIPLSEFESMLYDLNEILEELNIEKI